MITAQTGIMDRLRNETAEAHKVAESNPLEQALFRGTLPARGFVTYLEQRYCVHTVLDHAVRELAESDARCQNLIPQELYQSPNLVADLEFWDSKLTSIRQLASTAAFCQWLKSRTGEVRVDLLGAYYVFEGSKNGSRMLARVLAVAYGRTDGRGLRFMDPHGADQRVLWQAFRERMNAINFTAKEADGMVEAAKATFAAVSAMDTEIWNTISAHSCCGGACHA